MIYKRYLHERPPCTEISKTIHSYFLRITNLNNISFGNEMDIKLNQQ